MIQVATILPQNYLHAVEQDSYHMCLAHLIGKEGMESYTDFFKRQAAKGNYVIMDNGLIEGAPQPIEVLYTRAQSIKASELVLPDVFRGAQATLSAVEEALKHLDKIAPKFPVMAVAQGATLEEWVDCAYKLIKHFDISCLGIPKVLVDIAGRDGRIKALQALDERLEGDFNGVKLHLLGCWQSSLEISMIAKLVEQKQLPEIRGVDSAIAYVYARAGKRLSDDDRPDSHPIDFKNGTCDNPLLLGYNIAFWQDCVNMQADKTTILT